MLIRVGFDIAYSCPQPVATVLKLGIEHGRTPDLIEPDRLIVEPIRAAARIHRLLRQSRRKAGFTCGRDAAQNLGVRA